MSSPGFGRDSETQLASVMGGLCVHLGGDPNLSIALATCTKTDAFAGRSYLVHRLDDDANRVSAVRVRVREAGLSINAAIRTYSTLTVGDGLVSQIPGLIIATTAGILVTKASSNESGSTSGV